MTIRTTPWRLGAVCLVAAVGIVLALALAAGDAQTAPPDDDEEQGFGRCEKQWVCLFQDANGKNRIIAYKRYGTYQLKGRSMVGKGHGVSSYYNHQSGGARATLYGPGWRWNLENGAKLNIPRALNDKATVLKVYP